MRKNPKIGAHVSVAGGIENSPKRAEEMGAECMQIFAGSPRRYEVSMPSQETKKSYKEELEKRNISPVYIHATYLLNLATEESSIYRKSFKSLLDTLNFCDEIDANGVIYHPGSPKGGDKKKAIKREIRAIKDIMKLFCGKSFLLLENTAGEKKIGTTPDEIGYILEQVNSEKVKVCVDTAHSFQSGNINNFDLKQIKEWIGRWKKEVGLENIFLFHINDSLTKGGSKNDKHANIGEGHIGKYGFLNLMKEEMVANIPWILEVPGFGGKGPDKKNIEILKSIREKAK